MGLGVRTPAQAPAATTPFAWALIRLDGADTALLHVVDSRRSRPLATGDRVTVRFRPAAERIGAMADIEAFVPEGGAILMTEATTGDRGAAGPGDHPGHPHPARLRLHPGHRPVQVPPRPGAGQVHGPALLGVRQGLRALPGLVPDRRRAHHRGRASWPTSGTVTTYCVVNVPFAGQSIEIPYICAQVLLDGANLSFMGLIQEIPTDQIRMGMRVEAVWVEPDELDAVAGLGQVLPAQRRARRRLRDLQGVPVSAAAAARTARPVSVASFAQTQNVRRDDEHNEVEMLMPVVAEVFGNIGITKDDVDFICSGSTDYLIGGPFSFVMALDAVGVWPPRSESHVEMDGAWALYEAWVLLQEGEIDAALVYSFGRSSLGNLRRDPGPAARPVLPGPAVARPGQPGRPAGPGPDRRGQGHRGGVRRHRRPQPQGRPGQPQGPGGQRHPRRHPAGGRVRGLAAATPHPAPDHRRRRRHRAGRRGQGPAVGGQAGVDHRVRPPDGDPLAGGP